MQAAWPRAGHEAVSADQEVVPINRVPELEAKVRELEGLLGRKTMETEILCEVFGARTPRNPSCTCRRHDGTVPVPADALRLAAVAAPHRQVANPHP